jgi:RNA polymerase sigma-70 factor (ECF subfamily)
LILQDDEESEKFETIFHNHKNGIYNYALRLLGEKEGASDVVQEVFTRLFERQNGNYGLISNIKGWLFITARNFCLNIKRDKLRKAKLAPEINKISKTANPVDANVAILEKAMQSLDLKFREALVLREFEGLSYSEMAEILGLSKPAVKSLLYRARVLLRQEFDRIYSERI